MPMRAPPAPRKEGSEWLFSLIPSVQDSRTQGEEKSQPPASHLNTLRGDLSSGDAWRYVPVERVRFRDGAVEPTGCPGADHFKQEHDAVPRLLGDGQVDVLS